MEIKISADTFFVFDLDDTLFYEIDFLNSAYRHIAKTIAPSEANLLYEEMINRYGKKENVFQWLVEKYNQNLPHVNTTWLLAQYREHVPEIKLSEAVQQFLDKVKKLSIPCGLITDGRSITQRNKLKALDIENLFCDVIISEEFGSEKPDAKNYLYFQNKYTGKAFYFFGDNTAKDFIVPEQLGWTTVCLKNNGRHIHNQNFLITPCPQHIIHSFSEITLTHI